MDRKLFNEIELPRGEKYEAPEGAPIFKPYAGIEEFWPEDMPERTAWILPHEEKHLLRLGHRVAGVFGVRLCNDLEYVSVPEGEKATGLFCVLTRAGLQETKPGIFTWEPIRVVARYCVMVAIRCQLDAATSRFWILDARIWSNRQRAYDPIFDEKEGWIRNPNVLIQILAMYASMEGLNR